MKRVKSALKYDRISSEKLIEIFNKWRSQKEYFVLWERSKAKGKAYLCSKRGNDVYNYQINQKFKEIERLAHFYGDSKLFDINQANPKTNCLFLTLTYDTKLKSLDEDVTEIEDGAIVLYYAGQKSEYKVCLTPEAYDYLKRYLATRQSTRPEDPLFTSKKGIIEKRLAKSTLAELMKEIRYKVNPNQIRDGKRKDKAPNNAFRKRLEDIFANIEMHHKYTSYLLDHNKEKQDKHYVPTYSNEILWSKFKKAIPLITLDKSKQVIATKDDELEKLRESYEGEFKEKQEAIESQLTVMSNILASKTYLFYERLYGNNPDVMKKQMSAEEIEEWNWACKTRRKSELIIEINQSEKRLKDIQELKDWEALIVDWKKQGYSKDKIAELEKMADEIIQQYLQSKGLD